MYNFKTTFKIINKTCIIVYIINIFLIKYQVILILITYLILIYIYSCYIYVYGHLLYNNEFVLSFYI